MRLNFLFNIFNVAVTFFIILTTPLYGNEFFTINTADKPPYSTPSINGIYDQIILKLFNSLEIKVQINHLKSARSIENVNVGIDDAEYARIEGLCAQYKNIRMVNEKLIDFEFTAFSKNSAITITNWNTLKDYHIAFIRGWKIYENNADAFKSKILVSSEKDLFQLIEKDRVDIILYELLRGFDHIKKQNINDIFNLKAPLSVRGMYLYVNKKHEKMIPLLENGLRVMKKKGDYDTIIKTFIP